jgi:hypothetical protein
MHHLSMAEADAFMVAQVRLIEKGEWDEKKLGEVLCDLSVQNLNFDVTITGFDLPEIDLKIANLERTEDQDEEGTSAGPPVSRLTDLAILMMAGASSHTVALVDPMPLMCKSKRGTLHPLPASQCTTPRLRRFWRKRLSDRRAYALALAENPSLAWR